MTEVPRILELKRSKQERTARAAKGDKFGQVEQAGVEFLPEDARHSSPKNVFAVFLGGNLAFSVIIFGWLPITFGLNFWQAVTSSAVGLVLGLLLIFPMTLLGPRTGTNNPVSSGAHFGIRGRLIGSGITLLFAIAYAAIAVWTSGEALIVGFNRLFGTPDGQTALMVGYAIIAAEIVIIALFGHGTVVAMQKFVIPVAAVLLIVGIFAFSPDFVPTAVHTGYLMGNFWPTWLFAVTISMGGPLSYAPSVGDYTRRISRKRFSDKQIAIGACSGIFLGLFAAAVFGAYTASTFGELSPSYVADLIHYAPTWYVVPIILLALAGGLGQGVINIYASGLDLEAIFPRLSRTKTTLITSVIAVSVMYLGVVSANAIDSITGMTVVLNAVAGAWIAINVVGFFMARKGIYDPHDLQVFSTGTKGGKYWFTGGWNLRAVVPFAVGSVAGLLIVSNNFYAAPWANIAGGVDVSLPVAAVVAGALYALSIRLFPESSAVATVAADKRLGKAQRGTG